MYSTHVSDVTDDYFGPDFGFSYVLSGVVEAKIH